MTRPLVILFALLLAAPEPAPAAPHNHDVVWLANLGGGAPAGSLDPGPPTISWRMDETSDGSGAVTRADAIGSQDLTDSFGGGGAGYIPSSAGKLANGAAIDSTSEQYFQVAYTTNLNIGEDGFTVFLWFKVPDLTGQRRLCFRYDSSDTLTMDFAVNIDNSTLQGAVYYDNMGSLGVALAQQSGVTAGVWLSACVTWDRNAGLLKTSLNGAAFTTTACGVDPMGSVSSLTIGVIDLLSDPCAPTTDYGASFEIDQVSFWNNTPFSDAHLAHEHNGGVGRQR